MSAKPRFVCRLLKWLSMIHHSRACISTAPEYNAASFTPLQPTLGIVHGDLRLMCDCSAMETYFMKLPTKSYCADVPSRGRLEFGRECCNHATRLNTRWPRSVSLCGLPLCGLAAVAPRRFHFTITALTVDRGSSSRAEIL